MKAAFLLALLFTMTASTDAKRGATTLILNRRGSGYHPMHDELRIGNNPNEDIRANILLNMEGL